MKASIIKIFTSNAASSALGFLLSVILIRCLEPEEYGYISLIIATASILYTCFDFGLSTTQVVVINKKLSVKEESINLLFLSILILSTVIYVIFSVQLLDMSTLGFISTWFMFISMMINRFILSKCQAIGNWNKYSKLNIINNLTKLIIVGTVALFSVTVMAYEDLEEKVLVGYCISSIFAVIMIYLVFGKPIIINRYRATRNLKYLLRKTYPIGLTSILIVLTMRVDVFFIEKYLDKHHVGIYNAANTLALVFPIITTSLLSYFVQQSSKRSKDFLKEIVGFQLKKIKYIPIVILFIYFSAPVFIDVLYGDKYAEASFVFFVLTIAYIGGIVFTPIEAYFYTTKPKLIFNIRLLQLFAVVFFDWLLIKELGINGIAISIVITRLLGWFILSFICRQQIGILNEKLDKNI